MISASIFTSSKVGVSQVISLTPVRCDRMGKRRIALRGGILGKGRRGVKPVFEWTLPGPGASPPPARGRGGGPAMTPGGRPPWRPGLGTGFGCSPATLARSGGWRRGGFRLAGLRSTPESRPQLFRIVRLARRGPSPGDVLRLDLLDGSPRTAGPQPRDVLRLALQALRPGKPRKLPRARGARRGTVR